MGAENIKKTNILLMIDLLTGRGGTEKHLLNLAANIDRTRFNVFVCCFEGKQGTIIRKLHERGIPVIDLDLSRIYSLKALVRAFRLARFIKTNKIDIVQTYHFKSDTYGVAVSRLAGVRNIVSSRRDTGELKSSRHFFMNRIANRIIDKFVMVCDAVGRQVVKDEAVPERKMVTIYNGVDMERFSMNGDRDSARLKERHRIGDDAFVIGTTALFRPEKGYDVLVEGLRDIKPFMTNWKVLLLGIGPTMEYCREYCERNGMGDIVEFVGYTEEVEKYLSVMDVFCLASSGNEGFSNAILEAMAMGKPVVATDVGGNAEAVVHGETGFIIPPNDPGGFSDAILALYRDREKVRLMGRRARRRTEELFSLEVMLGNYERMYDSFMAADKPGQRDGAIPGGLFVDGK